MWLLPSLEVSSSFSELTLQQALMMRYDAQSAMIMSRYGHDSIFKCFRSSAGLLDCLYQVTVKR